MHLSLQTVLKLILNISFSEFPGRMMQFLAFSVMTNTWLKLAPKIKDWSAIFKDKSHFKDSFEEFIIPSACWQLYRITVCRLQEYQQGFNFQFKSQFFSRRSKKSGSTQIMSYHYITDMMTGAVPTGGVELKCSHIIKADWLINCVEYFIQFQH